MSKALRTRRDVQPRTQSAALLRARAGAAPGARRGLAMMLVLIALGVATVVTAATLTARSMSPYVAANAQDTAGARWSSESAANYAVAMLQTDLDWESLAGELAVDLPIAGGTATLTITNVQGDVPTADDRDLIITARAVVNGIESTSQKLVRITPAGSIEDALDPYLGEFAIYSQRTIKVDIGARIEPWGVSPEGNVPGELRMASSAASAADVQIGSASIVNPVVYFDESASMTAPDMLPANMSYKMLPLTLPLVNPAKPSTAGLPVRSATDLSIETGTPTTLDAGRYARVDIDKDAVVLLGDSAGSVYQFDELWVQRGTIILDGHVQAVVTGDFVLDAGALEFKNGSSLQLFVAGDTDIRTKGGWAEGAAGNPDADASMYLSPRNFVICTTMPTSSVRIENGSVLCAEIHAPQGSVQLGTGARLYGRISAANIDIQNGAHLYYDPSLDTRLGFSNMDGVLYDADGEPIEGLEEALAGYSGTMEDFASTVSQSVLDLLGGLLGGLFGGGGGGGETPRTAAQVSVTPVPTMALAFEQESLWNGTVATGGMSGTKVTLADLDRDEDGDGIDDNDGTVVPVGGAKAQGAEAQVVVGGDEVAVPK